MPDEAPKPRNGGGGIGPMGSVVLALAAGGFGATGSLVVQSFDERPVTQGQYERTESAVADRIKDLEARVATSREDIVRLQERVKVLVAAVDCPQ